MDIDIPILISISKISTINLILLKNFFKVKGFVLNHTQRIILETHSFILKIKFEICNARAKKKK